MQKIILLNVKVLRQSQARDIGGTALDTES